MKEFGMHPSQNHKNNSHTQKKSVDTSLLTQIYLGKLAEKMGIHLKQASPQLLVATMPVAGNTQPYGLLHGGAHLVLGETLGSLGASLWAGAEQTCLGIEINATHHSGTSSDYVTGTATAIKLGKTLACHEIKIVDLHKKLLSTVRITNIIIPNN